MKKRALVRTKSQKYRLDSFNETILDELNDNSRVSITQLGKVVGLGRQAVRDRIEDMEAAGIIEGYTVMINWDLIEGGVSS